jgi:transcriptional regulator with XRE-family HTH domain
MHSCADEYANWVCTESASAKIEARKKAGLTQQQLAKRLRKSQSFVAKYEAANVVSMSLSS